MHQDLDLDCRFESACVDKYHGRNKNNAFPFKLTNRTRIPSVRLLSTNEQTRKVEYYGNLFYIYGNTCCLVSVLWKYLQRPRTSRGMGLFRRIQSYFGGSIIGGCRASEIGFRRGETP